MNIDIEHVHCAECGKVIVWEDAEWYGWRVNGRLCTSCEITKVEEGES